MQFNCHDFNNLILSMWHFTTISHRQQFLKYYGLFFALSISFSPNSKCFVFVMVQKSAYWLFPTKTWLYSYTTSFSKMNGLDPNPLSSNFQNPKWLDFNQKYILISCTRVCKSMENAWAIFFWCSSELGISVFESDLSERIWISISDCFCPNLNCFIETIDFDLSCWIVLFAFLSAWKYRPRISGSSL